MADNPVIISRIQHRRGLRQDLPQPLRPGELGFTVDSQQLFIGSDPNSVDPEYAATSIYENTLNSVALVDGIVDQNLIAFTLPFKKFNKGEFDGVSKVYSWTPSSNTFVGSGVSVFPSGVLLIGTGTPLADTTANATVILSSANTNISVGDVVTGLDVIGTVTVAGVNGANITLSAPQTLTTANTLTFTPNDLVSIETNVAFTAGVINVYKGRTVLSPDTANATPATTADYSFSSTKLSTGTHTLTFRTAPQASDEASISYYSNSAVIHALTDTGPIYNGTAVLGFYTAYNIPTYRQIDPALVTVSPTSGTGFIGLQHKHIAVTADSTGDIDSPSSLTLGNLLVSANADILVANAAVTGNANIVFTVPSGHKFNAAGLYNYVSIAGTSTDLDGQALQLTASNATTITASVPTSWGVFGIATTAALTAGSSFGANANVTLTADTSGELAGITVASNVYLLDGSANSNLNANVFVVTSVGTDYITITTGAQQFTANAVGTVSLLNWGSSNTGSRIQILSENHRFSANSNIVMSVSSEPGNIALGAYTVQAPVTTDTFFIIPSTAPVKVPGYIGAKPLLPVSIANASIAPVISIDLSSATTLAEATALVAVVDAFPQLSITPDSTTRVYVTHKPAYSTSGVEFSTYEDRFTPTLSVLKIAEGLYTKDSTVKAKLEKWLNSLLESKNVNLFSSASVGEVYSSNPVSVQSLGTYALTVDLVTSEILFSTREEARDFNNVVNTIYFDRSTDDIRALVNLKTNLEIQLKNTPAVGDKLVTYGLMSEGQIPSSANSTVVVGMSQDLEVCDSYIIEYSVREAAGETLQYHRIGTLRLGGRTDIGNGSVIYGDVSSEYTSGTGSLTLSAALNGTLIDVLATSTLTPAANLVVKYSVRRWNS